MYPPALLPEIRDKIDQWALPSTPTEFNLLMRQLETVEMRGDEGPRIFFNRIDSLLATLRTIGVDFMGEDVVEITI